VEAAFVNQLGCGLVLPTMLVWTTRGLAYEIRGRGNGMWQASFAVGQFASGMLLTLLGKQLGGLLAAFTALSVVCFVVAAAAIVGALLARNSQPTQAPA
jgi:MFS family permease